MYDTCSNCGENGLHPDMTGNSGALTCVKCGFIAHESPMVSELLYQESSSGATSVQGTMVSAGQVRANVGGRQNGMDSREQTMANARRNIKDLASSLNIQDYIFESACGWFKLALTHNFVQGRRSTNVTAACLYIACRKEKTHHMLIDFSSKLQISVFSLGATFLKMVKTLHIVKLPLADPSIFISHFVEKLGFEISDSVKIISDAVKLAKRMKYDWIVEGRRPAGIAGACVLLAARMNGFRRSNNEIVAVAHVAEDTLARRLKEFRNTEVGNLSISEFRSETEVKLTNPPAFDKGIKAESRLKSLVTQKSKDLKKIKNYERQRKQDGQLFILDNEEESDDEEDDDESNNNEQNNNEANNNEINNNEANNNEVANNEGNNNEVANSDSNNESSNNQPPSRRSQRINSKRLSSLNSPAINIRNNLRLAKSKRINNPLTNSSTATNHLFKELIADCDFTTEELDNHIRRIEDRNKYGISNKIYNTPSNHEIEIKLRVKQNAPKNLSSLPKTSDILEKITSNVELDDIDLDLDDENYFNDEEMVKLKEIAWLSNNRDYLLEQERKRLKVESDILAGNTSGSKRPKRPRKRLGGVLEDSGVNEFGEVEVEESAKKISKKLNYVNLDTLNFS